MATGEELRDEAMVAVDAAANAAWKALYAEIVMMLATVQPELSGDDALAMYEMIPNAPKTHEQRASGPIWKRAERAGVIKGARWELSNRPNVHKSAMRIWTSCIYDGSSPADAKRQLIKWAASYDFQPVVKEEKAA